MVLFVDSCPRKDSRTRRLAKELLGLLHDDVVTVDLNAEDIPVLTEELLLKRDKDIKDGNFKQYRFACQIKEADVIVIAAPFWDLSFPAILKRYIENIMVTGLTFRYDETGRPLGMLKAKRLFYVTTAGGPVFDYSFGYGYIESVFKNMLGVEKTTLISAEKLDMFGEDVEGILDTAISSLKAKIDE